MNQQEKGSGDSAESYTKPGMKNVTLVYVLYLVGFVVGFTPIIGLVFAYMSRGMTNEVIDSHYTFQIRTFWIGLLASLVAFVLMFVFIGIFLFLAIAIWMIVRCVKGLMAASRNEPIPDPETYLF